MSVFSGSQNISEIYKGSTPISEIYHGSTLVWSAKQTFDAVRFDYTGAVQTWVVPKGIKKIHVDCVGGGTTRDGYIPTFGGRVECDLQVTPGEVLYLYVGSSQSRFNGGGNGYIWLEGGMNTCGADASDIRINGTELTDRIIVAGGAGCSMTTLHSVTEGEKSGSGGGLIGGDAYNWGYKGVTPAKGGTQQSGGLGGQNTLGYDQGVSGKLGYGGDTPSGNATGGGGGGYYGGGSGCSGSYGFGYDGAGGSSYTHPDLCSNVVHTQGYSEAKGNGWIIISPVE